MGAGLSVAVIRTIAGSGEPGLSGDGGPATAACLNEPKALTLDGQGHLLVADSENHALRVVDRSTGIIRTLVGAGIEQISQPISQGTAASPVAESDDPFDDQAVAGERAFAQQTDLSGTVRYVVNGAVAAKRYGGDGGPAGRAILNFPTAVTVDRQGNIYIADTMNHRVRRIEAKSGMITSIAGVGQPRFGGDGGPATAAGLNEPAALAVHGALLYIADQNNNRIRVVGLDSGVIRTVTGTGTASYSGDGIPAVEASLAGPSGLALGQDGTLYIADTFNGRIRAVDPVTGVIRTVVGDGGEYRYQGAVEAPSPSLSRPSGIAVNAEGNLYITDSDNHLVRRWDRSTGKLERVAGVGIANYGGDGGVALEASLSYPFGIVVDPQGWLLIADTFNHRIREIAL